MKSFAASTILAVASQALQLQYEMGDLPVTSTAQQAYDPERMSDYDALGGRGDTQEGADTREDVMVYDDPTLTAD